MKTRTLFLLSLLVHTLIFAQQGINYKAIVKDNLGNVVANDLIVVQFQVLQGVGMTNVYQETHTPTTNANGFIILNIGKGSTSDVFADIDWTVDDHFLNVQINTGAGLTDLGTTQFNAVPYAKHADVASNLVKLPKPFILGRSNQTSNGRFQFNGKYGWQAAQDMCEASYPNNPNVRAFTLEQIAQAIVLGNWDVNNLNNINGINFWAITPLAYSSNYPTTPHQNNSFGLNHNTGAANVGTRGQIIINATNIPDEPNGDNPSNTYLRVNNGIASGAVYPCMCGTYN